MAGQMFPGFSFSGMDPGAKKDCKTGLRPVQLPGQRKYLQILLDENDRQ
jgi:hypothetical protein